MMLTGVQKESPKIIDLATTTTGGPGYTVTGSSPNQTLTFGTNYNGGNANNYEYTIIQTGTSIFQNIVVESGITADITLDGVAESNPYYPGMGNEFKQAIKVEHSLMNVPIFALQGTADVTLTLKGESTFKQTNTSAITGGQSNAALHVPVDATLTIQDGTAADGKLTANGGACSAGIGGGRGTTIASTDGDAGTITIKSGTVTARGGRAVTVSGVTTVAGAGIGGGANGDGGLITISGGTVTAAGGITTGDNSSLFGGAGIGGGGNGSGGTIWIGGTADVTVNWLDKDDNHQGNGGAGIGGGVNGNGSGHGLIGSYVNDGSITIAGGTVLVERGSSNNDGAGIGGGHVSSSYNYHPDSGSGGVINISGGKVTVKLASTYGTATGSGAGIGSGARVSTTNSVSGRSAVINITGGTVLADGGGGAGIGGNGYGDGAELTINREATVQAYTRKMYADTDKDTYPPAIHTDAYGNRGTAYYVNAYFKPGNDNKLNSSSSVYFAIHPHLSQKADKSPHLSSIWLFGSLTNNYDWRAFAYTTTDADGQAEARNDAIIAYKTSTRSTPITIVVVNNPTGDDRFPENNSAAIPSKGGTAAAVATPVKLGFDPPKAVERTETSFKLYSDAHIKSGLDDRFLSGRFRYTSTAIYGGTFYNTSYYPAWIGDNADDYTKNQISAAITLDTNTHRYIATEILTDFKRYDNDSTNLTFTSETYGSTSRPADGTLARLLYTGATLPKVTSASAKVASVDENTNKGTVSVAATFARPETNPNNFLVDKIDSLKSIKIYYVEKPATGDGLTADRDEYDPLDSGPYTCSLFYNGGEIGSETSMAYVPYYDTKSESDPVEDGKYTATSKKIENFQISGLEVGTTYQFVMLIQNDRGDQAVSKVMELKVTNTTEQTVTNTVTGAYVDKNNDFEYTATFWEDGDTILMTGKTLPYTRTEPNGTSTSGTATLDENGQYAFTLRHGQSITFTDVPANGYMEITQELDPWYNDADDTKVVYGDQTELPSWASGATTMGTKVMTDDSQTIAFYNARNTVLITGLNAGTEALLALCLLALPSAALYTLKKLRVKRKKRRAG
jgi:hypothetical protein